MEGITIGQIIEWLAVIAGVIGSVGVIYKVIATAFRKALEKSLEPISSQINGLHEEIGRLEAKHDESDMSRVKDFLVDFLARVERGEAVDEEELERFWENYDFYDKNGGNSYIHSKLDKLKQQGKL